MPFLSLLVSSFLPIYLKQCHTRVSFILRVTGYIGLSHASVTQSPQHVLTQTCDKGHSPHPDADVCSTSALMFRQFMFSTKKMMPAALSFDYKHVQCTTVVSFRVGEIYSALFRLERTKSPLSNH